MHNVIHPIYMFTSFFESPRGVMDNTEDSGSSAGGSIPSEGTILLFQLYSSYSFLIAYGV